jgi:hypothetical protein
MIYTFTTISNQEGNASRDKRTWGYYHSKKKALHAVAQNFGGMDDCLYDYLVIEEYQPGVISIANDNSEVWFEWIHHRWCPCEKPTFSNGMISWAIG